MVEVKQLEAQLSVLSNTQEIIRNAWRTLIR
jgi:hypothetical protein